MSELWSSQLSQMGFLWRMRNRIFRCLLACLQFHCCDWGVQKYCSIVWGIFQPRRGRIFKMARRKHKLFPNRRTANPQTVDDRSEIPPRNSGRPEYPEDWRHQKAAEEANWSCLFKTKCSGRPMQRSLQQPDRDFGRVLLEKRDDQMRQSDSRGYGCIGFSVNTFFRVSIFWKPKQPYNPLRNH